MTLDLINFVPNTKIKSSEINNNFNQIAEDLSLTQGTVEQLNSTVATGCVPVGTVIWYAGSSVPDGYLLCDGSAVSRSTYATLYTAIGTTYGSGDGTTTFNLPLLTDSRYIQGNSTAGTQVAAQVPDHIHANTVAMNNAGSHTHNYYVAGHSSGTAGVGSGGLLDGLVISGEQQNPPVTSSSGTHSHEIAINNGLVYNNSYYVYESTVLPKSLTLLPCIKY